jgi:hypothetical protein
MPQSPIKPVSQILMFMHCAQCVPRKPDGLSPSEWNLTETGFTKEGIQVWCRRCQVNVAHVDFQGQKHPAMLDLLGVFPDPQKPKAPEG